MTGVARTSLLVAAAQLARRDAAIDATTRRMLATCLRDSGRGGRWLHRAATNGIGRHALRALERLVLPGIAAHYLWRKRRIAVWVEHAIAGGARQVVVLGAGFDPLAWHVRRRHGQVRVFEVDRAAPVSIKREALQRERGLDQGHVFVECDIGNACPFAALRDAGFDAAQPSVVVAEGLLMYLPASRTHALLATVAALPGRCALVATAMDVDAAGRPAFHRQRRVVTGWLRRGGEPFRWGASRNALHTLLRDCGFDAVRFASPDDPVDPDPCPGEWLLQAVARGAG